MNEIKTDSGRVVGLWDGDCVKQLMEEIARINRTLSTEKATDKLDARLMPHREQIHVDLQNFKAYKLWGCDKNGQCLVGGAANRIESMEKVLSFSLIDHH